jgi:DNA-binding transcriptional regulator YiaG
MRANLPYSFGQSSIWALRKTLGASQTLFATHLNVSPNAVGS